VLAKFRRIPRWPLPYCHSGATVAKSKVLVVDDDVMLSAMIAEVLTINNFDVTVADNVPAALKLISSQTFDVLLSDLHMPGAGDGLTIVSAMRHSNPKAATLLLSAFPEMDAAAHAIMLQADEILVKPMKVTALVDIIKHRLKGGPNQSRIVETVAAILDRETGSTIQDWYEHIETEELVMAVPMTQEQRCSHLPQLFRDLVDRLRSPRDLGTKEVKSPSSVAHGKGRRGQGYSAEMLVEESRQLQVSVFRTLQNNLPSIDFSVLLIGVMAIADEIDSQLSQAMKAYVEESRLDARPT
jgi:DNA-binding response OmpR family regulator